MRKNFITNISFLLLLNLLVKPFWILGIDRSVQNTIGPDAYGVYFALFNFAWLFQVVLDFGINNFNNRMVARQPEKLGQYLFSTLIAKFVLSVVYTILIFVAAIGVNFSNEQIAILLLLILMQILMSFYSFLRSNVNALHLFRTDAFLSVLDKLTTSVICACILWTNIFPFEISITTFIWVQIFGYVFSLVVAILILFNQHIKIKWNFDSALIKEVFLKSYPYALLGFLMTAYFRTDGVLLERMLGENGAYEAGIYASAFRLLDAMSILGFLFAGLLMPMFSRMIENKENIKPLFELGYTLMLIFSVAAGITIIFYRLEIMQLLYSTGDIYSANILGLLMLSFICISITYIYGSLITASGNIKRLNQISLVGFILNIVLNVLLIPTYKAQGSSIATVSAQLIILTAHMYYASKLFSIKGSDLQWMRSLVFIALVIILNFGIYELPIAWYFKFIIAGLMSVAASAASGLIKLTEIKEMIQPVMAGIRKRA